MNNHSTRPLFHKDFTLVVIGQIISLLGNAILRFALPLYVYDLTGSATLLGIVSASAFIPMVIMTPIGGIIADRVNKQRIMVVLDFFTAGMIAVFMLLMGQLPLVPLVIAALMLLYGIQGAYSPAVQASMPILAQGENLMPANAVVNLVQSLSGLLGPVVGGILYGQFGLWPILLVSCVCFAFSAMLELFIVIPYQRRTEKQGVWQLVRGDMKQSVHFLLKEYPAMAKVMLIIFCVNLFLSSMLTVSMLVVITGHLGMSSEMYGVAEGAMAAGGLLGGLLAGVFSKFLDIRSSYILLLICGVCIFPMGFVLMAGAPAIISFWVFTLGGAIIMASATLFSIQMLAFGQAVTPPQLVGKVLSFVMAVSMCSQPIGQAVYGVLFDLFAGNPGVVVVGSAAASVLVALYSKSAFRRLKAPAVA